LPQSVYRYENMRAFTSAASTGPRMAFACQRGSSTTMSHASPAEISCRRKSRRGAVAIARGLEEKLIGGGLCRRGSMGIRPRLHRCHDPHCSGCPHPTTSVIATGEAHSVHDCRARLPESSGSTARAVLEDRGLLGHASVTRVGNSARLRSAPGGIPAYIR